MQSFIFGGDTGISYESLQKRRAVAEALAAQAMRPAKNVGEGLSQVGNALAYRLMTNRLDKQEDKGRASANEAFQSIVSGLGGGSTPQAMPGAGGASGGEGAATGAPTNLAAFLADGKDPSHLQFAPEMGTGLEAFLAAAPGGGVKINSGFRSNDRQEQLFKEAVAKYGSEDAARKWVAPPGRSRHNHGLAADLAFTSPEAQKWAHENAAQFGLSFPMGHEPWHVEMAGQGGGRAPIENVTQAMAMQSGGKPQATVQPAGGGGLDPRLIEALSNPYLNKGQQAVLGALLEQQMGRMDPGDPFTLSEGQVRYGPDGKVIASGPAEAPDAPDIETLYDENTGQEYKAKWNPQTGQYERVGGLKAPSGMSLSVGPDGEVQFTQGGGKLTEGQSKDVVYATRANGALALIDQFGGALTSLPETVGGGVPVVGNYMKSEDFQKGEQAGTEFLQAILRKDTGATITPQETEEYGKVYLPRPGDKPGLLAQKQASRRRAVKAIEAGMPPQAILAMEKAALAEEAVAAPPAPNTAAEMTDEELLEMLGAQ